MAKSYKIAIIEDDIAIVQMYRMKFEAEGYEVATAGDGQAGLELVKSFKPDVVLLDLMMPVMDGDEMLRRMRQKTWGKAVKVLILTNVGENEAPPEIKNQRVIDFIVKADMTPSQVTEVVRRALAGSSEE